MCILHHLEPEANSAQLCAVISDLAVLATGFHDFGKAAQEWQQRARKIDPHCPPGLIGRTARTGRRIGIAHTPQGFWAAVRACEIAIVDSVIEAAQKGGSRADVPLMVPGLGPVSG